MGPRYDVLLRSGRVVDPATAQDGVADLAVANGKIAEVAPEIDPTQAAEVFDLRGFCVVPGVIDLHTHVSEWLGGKCGHRMMAQVGVTTALDMSGPVDSVMDMARDHGVGMNIACIEAVRPGRTVRDANPGRE
ncbi:MAG TPA: hypothetical protein VEU07_00345, partial [Candidatus Acidoferrum sp.]|nr:hypothetical protein [Candidatus Acidoferrum sp.]